MVDWATAGAVVVATNAIPQGKSAAVENTLPQSIDLRGTSVMVFISKLQIF
jgi:hypothetical protein